MSQVLTTENWAGFNLRSASQVATNKGLFIVLYGQGGGGKTTLAASIRFSEFANSILHCNIEGNAQVLAHIPEITVLDIFKWTEAKDLVKKAQRDDCPFDTFIWDNLTELQNLNIKHIVPEGKRPEIQHWGTCTADMLEFIRDCRILTEKYNKNVILTVWNEHEKNEATGRVRNHVAFTPSLAKQVPGIVSMVGLVRPVTNVPAKRILDFTIDEDADIKFQVAPTDEAAKIPLKIKYGVNDPVLADMLDAIKGIKPWPADKYN